MRADPQQQGSLFPDNLKGCFSLEQIIRRFLPHDTRIEIDEVERRGGPGDDLIIDLASFRLVIHVRLPGIGEEFQRAEAIRQLPKIPRVFVEPEEGRRIFIVHDQNLESCPVGAGLCDFVRGLGRRLVLRLGMDRGEAKEPRQEDEGKTFAHHVESSCFRHKNTNLSFNYQNYDPI